MLVRKLCALCAGVALSSAGQAQDVPAGVGVADRNRPQYDPLGIRAGSLLLYPQLRGQVEYDDNVRAASTGAQGDMIYTINPELRARTDLNRHALDARLYYRRNWHGKLTTEDVTEYGALARGVVDVTRGTRVRLSGGGERDAESRSSLASFSGSREPVRFNRYTAAATLEQEFGRLTLSGRGDWRKLTYQDAIDGFGNRLDLSFRDLSIKTGTAQASYRLPSGMSLLLRSAVERRRYALRPGDVGFDPITQTDRSANGTRIEGGVALELTSLVYGSARVGYIALDYKDPKLRDVKGLSYAVDLLWNMTPLTSVSIAGERRVDETSSQTTAGNLRTEGRVKVDHELLRNLILTAGAGIARINPSGPTAKSREFEGQLGARYMINRTLQLEAGYRYEKRSSDNPLLGYKSNNVFLSLTLAR